MSLPLRYRISRWQQAAECLSNNSRNLYITVSEFVNNETLQGTIIKVEHTEFGTLFAAMIKGEGRIVTRWDEENNLLPWLSVPQILTQLKKFGFDITYKEITSLDDQTIDWLMNIRNAGFDKISQVVVISRQNGIKIPHKYTIALKSDENSDLLTFGMSISSAKFTSRTSAGKILSLEDYDTDWGWLDSIYNINDILQENSDIEPHGGSELAESPIMIEHPSIEVPEGFTPYDETEEEQGG